MNACRNASRFRVYVILIVFTLIATSAMVYALRDRARVTSRHLPLADAALRLELEATAAHHYFEETLDEDDENGIQHVWEHLARAEWYAKAMLEGGIRPPQSILPAEDPVLRSQIETLRRQLAEYRTATQKYWEAQRQSDGPAAVNPPYVQAHQELLRRTGGVQDTIRQSIADDVQSHDRLQTLLIIAILLLALLLGLVFHRHVDDGRRAEQALRESEGRYRETMAASLAGIYIVEDGQFRYVNAAITKLFGYEPEELLHKLSPSDLVAPEERERMRTSTRQRLSGKPGEPCEIRCCRKDGTYFDAIIWGAPVPYRGHQASVGTLIDITDRKRAEQALKESEQRFRLLAENIPSTIYLCLNNPRYSMLYLNDRVEELTGFPKEDFLTDRRSLFELVHSDDATRVGDQVKEALRQKQAFKLLYRLRHRTGEWRWMEGHGAGVWNEQGDQLMYIEGLITDVTERENAASHRRHLEERVKQAQKLESLGVLAGGIAHDFNNLLVGILGHAGLAQMDLPADSPAFDSIGHIEKAAQRAADLAQQMLAMSGKGRFVIELINMSALISAMSPTLKSAIGQKAELRIHLGEDLPPVRGDAAQIRQMVTHLINNASDALEEEAGVITLSTGGMEADRAYLAETFLDEGLPPGYYMYVEVSDSGRGMDRKTIEKIFDPFFTTKFTGRGLGLATVLGIVRGHKGALHVQSKAGVGTTVRVLFPRPTHTGEESSSPEGEATMSTSPPRREQTILVADDEEVVRTVAQMALERHGYTVLTADDGEETVRVFRENAAAISAVLLDLTMPRMSGEEALREIRTIRADVPVLISSGYDEQETSEHFAGQGLAGFVQKPYRPHELIRQLEAVLRL